METLLVKAQKDLKKFEKDIKKVHRLLCYFLKDPELAHKWLYLRNDVFLGQTPRDMIKDGRTGKVIKTIKQSVEYQNEEKRRAHVIFKKDDTLESTIAKAKAVLHGVPVPKDPVQPEPSEEVPTKPEEEQK